jgi:hypothetical protein
MRIYKDVSDSEISFSFDMADDIVVGDRRYGSEVLVLGSKDFKVSQTKKSGTPVETISGSINIAKDTLHNLNEIHKAIKSGVVKDLFGFTCPYIGENNVAKRTFEILSNNEMLGILDEKMIDAKRRKDKNIEHDLKIARIADRIFSKLPNFDSASIDEIIDIRKEISKYTIGFKKELTTLADQVNSSVWDKYFKKDVENQLTKYVLPKVEEIENAVKENGSLLEYISKSINSLLSPNVLAPTSIAGLVLTNLRVPLENEMIACSCGIVASLAAMADVANKMKKENQKIKQNDLYLVYRTKKRLSGQKPLSFTREE